MMPDIRNLRDLVESLTPTLDTKRAAKKEPPKRWRNRYWSPVEFNFSDRTGMIYNWKPGVNPGGHTWPSKDIAETIARIFLENPEVANIGARWVGAFPEEGEGE